MTSSATKTSSLHCTFLHFTKSSVSLFLFSPNHFSSFWAIIFLIKRLLFFQATSGRQHPHLGCHISAIRGIKVATTATQTTKCRVRPRLQLVSKQKKIETTQSCPFSFCSLIASIFRAAVDLGTVTDLRADPGLSTLNRTAEASVGGVQLMSPRAHFCERRPRNKVPPKETRSSASSLYNKPAVC